jgi:hypothetical protein
MELTVKMRHSSLASIDAQQEKTQADSQGTLFIGAGAEANEKIYDMASMFDNYPHTENKFSLCAYICIYIPGNILQSLHNAAERIRNVTEIF